jgi:hypothetical protein
MPSLRKQTGRDTGDDFYNSNGGVADEVRRERLACCSEYGLKS